LSWLNNVIEGVKEVGRDQSSFKMTDKPSPQQC